MPFQKVARLYLFLHTLAIYCFQGHFCFFLRHSSGRCVRNKATPYFSNTHTNIWYLELTNQCTLAASQFRFLDEGILIHVSSTGCILPLNGKLSPGDGINLVVVNSMKIVCANKTAQTYTSTATGALRHSSGKCIQPHAMFQSTPAVGAKLEYTSTCNTTKQGFIFGSVTCEGSRTSDINCPSSQVIVVTKANYGGFGKLKTCDYKRNYNCLLPASLCHAKRKCDGRHSCEIDVTNEEFQENPCRGMSKYLYLEYKCVNKTNFKKENIRVQSVRLGSQVKPGQGFVEVLEDSQPDVWQRLCVTKSNGAVVCRSLGYFGYEEPDISWSRSREAKVGRIFYGDMYCNRNEENVSSCCIAKSTANENPACAIMAVACTVCSEPMLTGENRPHFVFSASNSIPGYSADKATFASNGSWCGVGTGHYLEIDLGQKYVISQLAILGDGSRDKWVTSYELSYSENKREWYQGIVGGRKLLTGNTDNNGKLATSILDSSVTARFIKILPKSWNGKPCLRLEICGHRLLPDAPENITLTSVSVFTAHVSWLRPSETGDGLLTDYLILISGGNIENRRNVSKVGRLFLDTLKPHTRYTLVLQAGNKHGYGEKAEITFRTRSTAPDGPPTNVKIIAESPASLNVSWNPPQLHQINGVITGYEICLANVESAEECDLIIRTKTSNIRVCDLKRATTYKIKILARNDAGFGDYSVEYFQMTNGAAPSCNISTITEKSFVINLQEPRSEIRFCQIIVMALPSDDNVPRELLYSRNPVTYLEAHGSVTPTPYVAAEFRALDFGHYKEFTVGDGKLFPAVVKQSWYNNGAAVQKHLNGPLSPDTTYTVIQRFYSDKELLYSTAFLPPVKTTGQGSFGKIKDLKLQLSLKRKKTTESSLVLSPQTKNLRKTKKTDTGSSSDKFKAPFIVVTVLLVLILLTAAIIALLLFRRQHHQDKVENGTKTSEEEKSTAAETIPMNQIENNDEVVVA